ncbi:MAG TPA: nucleotidyltransferase [Solirubrobacteraceae bacterium]
MTEPSPELDEILDTLKKCAAVLRDADIPFMVGGGIAAWARGGPESVNDLDLVVRPSDAESALATLESVGLRGEHPPEGWLLKAWDGEVLVDLIFKPQGLEIDDEILGRAEQLNVKAMEVPVMPIADVMCSKLLALNERWLDYDQLLQMARACREQVDWDEVRGRTAASPFARAFFEIVDGLGITGERPPASPARVAGS